MASPPTQFVLEGGVATITLTQPDNRNVLNDELIDGLTSGMRDAIANTEVRAIVVTNDGSAFCAGADLKAIAKAGKRVTGSFVEPLELVLDSPKPTIARIDGHCVAGGVGLAAAFDISVARSDVKFGFTEARIGVAPAIIAAVCLPKVRMVDANELFLRASRFDAGHAAEVGLINRAVDGGELDSTVAGTVADVVAGGPDALSLCKRIIGDVPAMSRSDAFAWCSDVSAEIFMSDEAQEGIAAFRERRQARWVP